LSIFIGDGAIHYQFSKADKEIKQPSNEDRMKPGFVPEQTTYTMDRMDVELAGANKNAQVITEQKQDYSENYFTDWSGEKGAAAYTYNKITYKNIYPNIDWVLYTSNGTLEHEFIVHQGGKVSDIKLKYGGAKDLKINAEGNLTATTPQGTITEKAPDTYQKDGKKVASAFVLHGNLLSYSTGAYTGDLIIDPTLSWATYFGGSTNQQGYGVATDGSGNVYISGNTSSTSSIATSGAYQTIYGGGSYDAFLVKFNSSGAIQWATYFGGSGIDYGTGVATDGSGNVYMTGYTGSSSAIATSGAYQTTFGGSEDVFLVKFNSSGAIQWATYYGGSGVDEAFAATTDGSGNVYITGYSASASAIATSGAYQTTFGGGNDAFLAKFNNSGAIQWATYYGGSTTDAGTGVAIDGSGNVFIVGYTYSSSAIATSGAYQTTYGGACDGFLAKFNSSGAIQWGTYFGGSGTDYGEGVASDGSGNVYINGQTSSVSGIATSGAYQTAFVSTSEDDFLAKFNNSGAIQWATYYGGSGGNLGYGVATDGSANIYITGYTSSASGIATSGAYQTAYGGVDDAFLADFNTSGALQWATYYGGSNTDEGQGVATDPSGNVYIIGETASVSGIATSGAYQTTYGGTLDAFLAKFSTTCPLPVVAPITGTATICQGSTTTLFDVTSSGVWSSGATGIATVSSGTITGVASGITDISYTVTNGCGSTSSVRLVTVNPIPSTITVTPTSLATVCTGGNATFTAVDSFPTFLVYQDFNSGMTGEIGGTWTVTNTGTPSPWNWAIDSPAALTDVVTYASSPLFGDGTDCIASDADLAGGSDHLITVLNSPVFSTVGYSSAAVAFNYFCYSQTPYDVAAEIDYSIDGGATWTLLYNYLNTNITGVHSWVDGTPTQTIALPSAAVGQPTVMLRWNYNSAFGYFWAVDNIVVTGQSAPAYTWAGFSGATGLSCTSCATTTITPTASGANLYGVTAIGGGCAATAGASVTVTVGGASSLIAPITGTTTVCLGYTTTLSDATPTGTWSSSNTAIATVGTGGIVTGVAAGNVLISYTASTSCGPASALAEVTVGNPVITTFAGTGTSGFTPNGSAATATAMTTPIHTSIDASGNIYYTDYLNSVVRRISTAGIVTTYAGNGVTGYLGDGGPATNARLDNPAGTAIDAAGNLYIADYQGYEIRKVTPAGIISTIAGTGSAGIGADGIQATASAINHCWGVAVDGSGNVYFSDRYNHDIRKINTSGIVTTIAGTGGTPGFSGDGGPATAALLDQPLDLIFDPAGNLYIADGSNNRIRKITPAGIISTIAGNGTPGFGGDGGPATALSVEMNVPVGLALDSAGDLYFGDYGNNRIRKITPAGIISTIAGTGGSGYNGDGISPTAATLTTPQGVAVYGPGNIYICDASNYRIRKISPVGTSISASATAICQGATALFTDPTPGGTWTSSNTAVVTVGSATGIVTGAGGGTATITYTYPFTCGLTYVTQPVTVTTTSAGVITGLSTVCLGSTIPLTDATSGGTWSSSNTAIATVGSTGVVNGITTGNVVISYTISNSCGTFSALSLVSVGNLIINTVVGTGTAGFAGDAGQATAAELDANYGMAYNQSSGMLYIADQTNNRIRAVNTTTGVISTIAGITGPGGFGGDAGPATAAKLDAPTGVALDAAGNIYIADASNNRVREITLSTGIINTIAGTGTPSFSGDGTPATGATINNPRAVLIDGSGNVLFSDGTNNRVRKITTATGIITTIAGSTTAPGFGGDGGQATLALMNLPRGIALDGAGNLYIADMSNNRIREVNAATGIITTIAGNSTPGAIGDGGAAATAEVNAPTGVTIDPAGNIIISDAGNNKVRSINAAGIISTTVGTGTAGFSGDGGAPAAAKISGVRAVLYLPNADYYIADEGNNRVRLVKPSTPPAFTADVLQSLTICENAAATSLNTMLVITDPDLLQTETWSTLIAPLHGTLVAAATGTSNGGTVTPTGLSYTPTAGYSGLDSFTVQVSDGCTGITKIVVTINPLPAVPGPILGPVSFCLATGGTLSDAITGGVWTSTAPGVATIGSSSGIVSGVTAGYTTISYTIANSCGSNSVFSVDTIVTSPGPITGTLSVCVGNTSPLGNTAPAGIWTSSNGAIATIGSSSGIVNALTPGTTTITYSVGGICNATAIVTVNANPSAITPATPVSMCVGATASLGDPTLGGTWSSQSIVTATVGTSGTVTGVAAGTVNISYTNVAGCSAVKAVTVLVTPVALSPSSIIVCTGNTITLGESVGGGVWSSTASGIASVVSGTVSGVTVGTASISYTIGTCAVGAPVTVNLSPNAGSITGPASMCTGTPVTFTDGAAGGVWNSSNPAVATVDASGLVTPLTGGSVTISYAVTNSCGTATATQIVTVTAAADAGTIIGTTLVCAGTFTELIDTTSGGIWSASNGNATISSAGILVGVIPGIDTIRYSTTNVCGLAVSTKIVTVGLFLTAGSLVGPDSVCSGSFITLTDTATGGVWSSSSTSASVSGGIVTGLSTGIDTIKYTVTSGCGSAIATQVVTVNPLPVAGSITGPIILCVGFSATYTDPTSGGAWSCTNSTASITSGGLLTALAVGNDTINYIVTNGCGTAVAAAYVTMGPSITAGSISGPASVCVGSGITLNDATPGGVWSASNTTAAHIGGAVTGVTAGVDTISYTVTASCGSVSAVAIVTVNPLPDAGSISGPSDLCMGTPATYTDAAPGGVWGSSNGTATITGGGFATPVSPGTDTISYSVTNGCGTVATTKVISILIIPLAGTISGAGNVCAGASVTLTDVITGGTWSASNGNATVSGGVVTGVSSGLDTISYTVTSSCGTAVATQIMEIDMPPSPGAIAGPSGVCIGSSITLTDGATGGTWSASNADAAISTGGLVTPITPGTDTISYTVTNACGSFSATHIITVSSGLPTAGSITGPGTVCAGAAITLADAAPGGVWHSSNSSATVAGGIVTGVIPGTDTVSYAVTNGCGAATATAVITITTGLAAGSITGASGVCIASTVTLTDAVTGGVWSSSNADATVAGGIVTGVTAGTDTISYTITGSCGTASATKVITVSVSPSAGSITGATGVCAGATTTLTDAATGGIWSVANAKATVSVSGVVTGVLAGLDTIRYTVTNACGSASAIHVISINSAPGAGSIAGAASVCPGAAGTLTDGVSGGTWSSGNSTIATVTGGTVTGISSGTVTISYTVSNSCGHTVATHSLTVLPDSLCSGLQVNGIGNNPTEELKVSPNPNSGAFTMNLVSDIDEEVQVVITNVLGEKVQEFKTTSNKVVDLQMNEAAGIYLLTATTANGRHVAKVIIN